MKLQIEKTRTFQPHPFHLVETSPWPFVTSFSLLTLATGAALSFNNYYYGEEILYIGFLTTALSMFFWFRDIIAESSYQGHHTLAVANGISMGVALFIASEVMFFFSIFWAFFHSSLSPAAELGFAWPPLGIEPINPFELPLLNTVLLLSSGVCLKWNKFIQNSFISQFKIIELYHIIKRNYRLPFNKPKTLSLNRIGPHSYEVLSLLIGSLLGEGTMERDGNGSRFCFYQEKSHGEYLLWLHQFLYYRGYSKEDIPRLQTRVDIHNKLRYIYRFRTFTFSSFNSIYDAFYSSGKKIIPQNLIEEFISPLFLAVWIMDDGGAIQNRGIKLATHSFTLDEIQFISSLLKKKFSLDTSIVKTGAINQYNIYFPQSSLLVLINIVKPYIHPSMLYKLHINI
jgi:Cytochrome c oxidase subunit III/LAGLIDADG DNA endonuclease family